MHSFPSVHFEHPLLLLCWLVILLLFCSYHFHRSGSPPSSSVMAQWCFSWADWWIRMQDTTAAQPPWPTERRYTPALSSHWPVRLHPSYSGFHRWLASFSAALLWHGFMLFAEQLFSWGLISTPELYRVVGWKLHALGWKELNWKAVDGTCQRCFCFSHLLVVCVCACMCACVRACLSVSVCFNKQGYMMKLKLVETSVMILVFEVTCQSYCSMCELFWFSFFFP